MLLLLLLFAHAKNVFWSLFCIFVTCCVLVCLYSIGEPTSQPSGAPSVHPSSQPSLRPILSPTLQPTAQPSRRPFSRPSLQPSTQPTCRPSMNPGSAPTGQPSQSPLGNPSRHPSRQPNARPSHQPTRQPSKQPVPIPTRQPSSQPYTHPSARPSHRPTAQPSKQPIGSPSTIPTDEPTSMPSPTPVSRPSAQPSSLPSLQPSACPSVLPSHKPTSAPLAAPSFAPSRSPTMKPTVPPTKLPTHLPSLCPSAYPTFKPTFVPSAYPTCRPTTTRPSLDPSHTPSAFPTILPSPSPTYSPTPAPTEAPITTQWVSKLSQALAFLSMESVAGASPVIYSEAFVNSEAIAGGCQSWQAFLSQLYQKSLSLPIESMRLIEWTSLTAPVNDTAASVSSTIATADGLSAVLSVLWSSTDSTQSYRSVYAEKGNWVVGICAHPDRAFLYVNQTDTEQSASNYRLLSLSPCASAASTSNSSQCLPLSYLNSARASEGRGVIKVLVAAFPSPEELTPGIQVPIIVWPLPRKMIVQVEVRGKSAGTVYCAAFSLGHTPTSPAEIVMAGNVAAFNGPSIVNVSIASLSPSTKYTIFCLPISLRSPSLSAASFLDTLHSNVTAETACCKNLYVTLTTPTVFTKQSQSDFAHIFLEAPPSRALTVTLSYYLKNTQRIAPFLPQIVNFTAQGPTEVRIALTSIPTAGMGRFYINVAGQSSQEYTAVYPNGNTVLVISSGKLMPAPVLIMAQFSSDGVFVSVSFDSPTDRGGSHVLSTSFPCSLILHFRGSLSTMCQWTTDDSTTVIFPATLLNISVGDKLSTVSDVIRAKCSLANATGCSVWPTTAAKSVRILQPDSPDIPNVVIAAPSVIGTD